MNGARSIDVSGLLTIDVASELRKLSQAQLQGPWQLPAELVRRALRDGAGHIDVARRVAYGSGRAGVTMQAAAAAFDLQFTAIEEHVGRLMEVWRRVEQFKPAVLDAPAQDDRRFLNGPRLSGDAGHA